ncbi:hypothetical protein FC19_GL000553 [Liquorilactobacillus aquaticus DSM 21051]|uniref:Uncharacterized protein n=1 Tax=Liquorilactobacillus aquaticus DSM 21051 TaxID=1423725 RepID=A0A0R2CWS8_9LACO|nr:hypothetical protein FC19_GL000553 [Liquorilactobacillus aquaticus DSM 21051]
MSNNRSNSFCSSKVKFFNNFSYNDKNEHANMILMLNEGVSNSQSRAMIQALGNIVAS